MTEAEWWEQNADDLNDLARSAQSVAVPTGAQPVKLNPDGSEASSGGTNPYGTKYKFFEFNDRPARCTGPGRAFEVLRNGRWEPFYDLWRFMHEANPVDKGEFDRMVAGESDGEEDPEDVMEFGMRAPPGGIFIGGKRYQGGRYIPNAVLQSAPSNLRHDVAQAQQSLPPPKQSDGEDLAEHYAAVWNMLAQNGREVPPEEVERAQMEMRERGWILDKGEDGTWTAEPILEG